MFFKEHEDQKENRTEQTLKVAWNDEIKEKKPMTKYKKNFKDKSHDVNLYSDFFYSTMKHQILFSFFCFFV